MARPLHIGLLLWTHIDYPRRIAMGARRLADEAGPVTFELVRPLVARLREIAPRCDGLISFAPAAPLHRAVAASGLPAIDVAESSADALPRVTVDHRAIGRLGAEHLGERGLSRLAFVAEGEAPYSRLRREGFLAAASAGGSEVTVLDQATPAHLQRWLRSAQPPLGILAEHDMRARRVLDACLAVGATVPDEVAIVGVDDNPLICKLAAVPLTSIDNAGEAVGLAAARLLWAWLTAGRRPPAMTRVAPGPVRARASSDRFHHADPIVAAALTCIARHASRGLTVDELALQVGVSRRAIEKHMRAVLQRSPHEEIQRRRFALARELLAQERQSLAAIARACGYSDRRQFTRAFRAYHHCSPSVWRRSAVDSRSASRSDPASLP